MLENLQKTSTHHIGLQPNSRVSRAAMFYSRNKRVTVCSCVDGLTALKQLYHYMRVYLDWGGNESEQLH